MNAFDILKYGQQTMMEAVDGLEGEHWFAAGVCGVWSAKDVVAHLVSYEWLLTEILARFLDGGPTPYLDEFVKPGGGFNDRQVALRNEHSTDQVLSELAAAHAQVMSLLVRIPNQKLSQPGTIPWYGAEYSLDDVIVYMYYGHKREHSAQVSAFRDRLDQ